MTGLVPATLQQVAAARRAYFEQGVEPDGVIDQAIFRSWTRCLAADRHEVESVAFQPVGRSHVRELMDRNGTLLQAASEPLNDLTKAVSGAGYAVLLTDSRGYSLTVAGALDQQSPAIRQAFRQGVDLSEDSIGTSAMACALAERRAVRVFGPEHFFSAIHRFHCAAAPIVDPEGTLIGSVDITRDSPKPDLGALSLVNQCARAIERELFRQRPYFLTLRLSWHEDQPTGEQELIFAFGSDGEILALNENARRFIGLGMQHGMYFEDIFEGRFSHFVTILRDAGRAVPIRLRSGLCLFASSGMGQVSPRPRSFRPGREEVAVRTADAQQSAPLPEFGDPAIAQHIGTALRALSKGLPLLIQGETGTGKDVLANVLHKHSRQSGPLVAINCAAIPESLIEGELFGHAEGAYTGARRGGAPGKIEMADGGTLFLDEIGDMALHLQARLLRVLETREVSRLGAATSRKVDFQLICATHQDIPLAIKQGRFREDLYYRINGFSISLSPLRARCNLPALMVAMLNDIAGAERRLSPAALALLETHAWPGNARELKHALTYACAITDEGDALEPEHFPPQIQAVSPPLSRQPTAEPAGVLNDLENQAIQRALQQANGHVPSAAQILGMSRATLYRRLKRN
ncbi:MAG TPA: sigma-54-dependent Fis family transcriptional regulator [Rhodocyclaceae bacterium]|nr:sigma-54-dependent Fis family transcriptional regulator [Rhodocyclaceae bacterium]